MLRIMYLGTRYSGNSATIDKFRIQYFRSGADSEGVRGVVGGGGGGRGRLNPL